jgi:hypothetical protein
VLILKVNCWRSFEELARTTESGSAQRLRVSGRLEGRVGPARALRLMEQRDELRTIQLQELRQRIDKGLSELDRGQGADGETFMEGLLEDLDTREAKRSVKREAKRKGG